MALTIFDSRNPAGRAGLELTLMTTAIAQTIGDAMEAGHEAADAGRERLAAYEYACDLAEARSRAEDLGNIAIRAVEKVAVLEAEVRRLKIALAQRQAHIDRMRVNR